MIRVIHRKAFPQGLFAHLMDIRERLLFAIILVFALTFLASTKALDQSTVTSMFTALIGYFFGSAGSNRRNDNRRDKDGQ